jgi:biopolymer transport protein ExbB
MNVYNKILGGNSLVSLLVKGGWVMIPLGIMSVFVVYVCIERMLALRNSQICLSARWLESVNKKLIESDYDAVYNICTTKHSAMSNIVKSGLDHFVTFGSGFESAIESSAQEEVRKLETNLSLLATMASLAPLLGFFGTVTGMIQSFMAIANETGSVPPSILSAGIYEALVTTAAGLFIGIIANFGYNLASIRVVKLTSHIEKLASGLIELLSSIQRVNNVRNSNK